MTKWSDIKDQLANGFSEYAGDLIEYNTTEERKEIEKAARMRVFKGGATRDQNVNKLQYEGFISPAVLREYAKFMHIHRKQADGSLRDPDNWQRGEGIPKQVYMDSLLRHVMATWLLYRGEEVEAEMIGGELVKPTLMDCLCGVLFNTMGLMWQILRERKAA